MTEKDEVKAFIDDECERGYNDFLKECKPIWYDRQGNPISEKQADEYLNDSNYKTVKRDEIGEYLVSTVWTGINMNILGSFLHIFETMIFSKKCLSDPKNLLNWTDLYMDRYSTEEEAIEGHKKACEIARKGNFEDD